MRRIVVLFGLMVMGSWLAFGAKTLTIIMEEVPDTDVIRELIPEFEAQNPDLKVVIDAMPYEAMRDKILTEFMAPVSSYDIIIVDNPWADEFAAGGFLVDLTDRVKALNGYDFEDFAAPIRDIGVYKGRIFGLPFYNYALALIVRQDIFDERGIPVPTNIADYVKVCRELTDKKAGFYGAAMQAKRGYKIFEEGKNYMYALGADVFDAEGNIVINSHLAKAALHLYIANLQAAAPKGAVNWGFDEAFRLMASGKAATMITYNWMLPSLNNPEKTGNLAGKFAFYEVPGGKAVLGAWYWAIPHNAADVDASWRFISWVTSKEIEKKRVILGGAPVRMSVLNDPEVWEKGYGKQYYLTLVKILEDAEPLVRGLHAEEIIQAIGLEMNNAAAGIKTVDQALDDAAKAIAEILRE